MEQIDVSNLNREQRRSLDKAIRRKRAGIYGRVSTDKQAKKGLSIERQLLVGHEVCEKNDFEIYREYVDKGRSGKKSKLNKRYDYDESDIKKFLDNIHAFNQYSYNNQMLIFLQNSDASYVTSLKNYNKMGYHVNKDEVGIKILIPCFYTTIKVFNDDGSYTIKSLKQLSDNERKKYYDKNDSSVVFNREKLSYFKVGNVYDISQTNMPIDSINKELNPVLEDQNAGEFINDFIKAIYRDGFKVKYDDISNGAKGYCDHKDKIIVLKNGLGNMMKLKVLIHEYAHALAHKHLEYNHQEYADHRNKYEVEAETIAYVVNRYFGLNTADYSLNYIYSWSKEKDIKEVDDSLQIIVNSSKRIINNFEKMQKKSLDELSNEIEYQPSI